MPVSRDQARKKDHRCVTCNERASIIRLHQGVSFCPDHYQDFLVEGDGEHINRSGDTCYVCHRERPKYRVIGGQLYCKDCLKMLRKKGIEP